MSNKVYTLVTRIVEGVEIISSAIVTFAVEDKVISAAVVSSILIAGTAINEICGKFVKE